MSRAPVVVKRSYNRVLFVLGAGIMSVSSVLFILSMVWLIAFTHCQGDVTCAINKFSGIANSITLIILTAPIFFWWYALARYDAQRQAVARGVASRYAPAAVQPTADVMSLAVPLTVRVAPGRSMLWLVNSIFLGFFGVGIFVALLFVQPRPSLAIILLVPAIIYTLLAAIVLTIFIVLRQRITITDDAITIYEGGRIHRVRWAEARIFICPKASGQTPGTAAPHTFELASLRGRVQWSNLPEKTAWRADLPNEDYNHIIDALNAYVVARTELTLYDFRG
jgi:hypothetical protein